MNCKKNQVYRIVREYYTAEVDMSGERPEVLIWMHRTVGMTWGSWDDERGELKRRFDREMNRELTHLQEDVLELIDDVCNGRAGRWEGRLLEEVKPYAV